MVELFAVLTNDVAGFLDGRQRFFSSGQGEPLELTIPRAAKYLTLMCGPDGNNSCDRGTFANPVISCANTTPQLRYTFGAPRPLDGEPPMLGTSWVLGASPGMPLADRDDDSIPDAFDNCERVANRDQSDADFDGIGDACVEGDGPLGGRQRPVDCNQDGDLDLSDGICLLGHLFLGRPGRLPCGDGTIRDPGNIALLDSSGDRAIDLSDAVGVFSFLFLGGRPPRSCIDSLCASCVAIEGCGEACASER